MPSYFALLRGINVSGQKPVKMDRLRATFATLGFSSVQTYLQSGNVVFQAPQTSATGLAEKITAQILADFGFSVTILIRTPDEWGEIRKHNPFAQLPEDGAVRLYVTFLSHPAPATAEATLKKLAIAGEQICVHGREIYLYCPAGYGNTKLSNTVVEKKLSVTATTRNWRTVNALFEMM